MILLLGASGYIGQAFEQELQRRGEPFRSLSRSQVDYDDGWVVEKDMTRPEFRAVAASSPERIRGFDETMTPNFTFRDLPCSFYSGTKALGEEAIHDVGQNYIWPLHSLRRHRQPAQLSLQDPALRQGL